MKKYSRIIALLLAVVLVLPGAGLVTQAKTNTATPHVERLGGAGRVETSVLVSKEVYPTTADVVILAGYNGGVDALTATSIAAKMGAPVLFTEQGKLTEATKLEIVRLGAKTVHILGGEKAVSKEVFTAVDALTGVTANRVEGKDRYETAAAVATVLASTTKHAFVALGTEVKGMFPDALAVGPAAAKLNSPILLTQAGKLPVATKAALAGIEKVTLVGGNQAITPAVVTELTGMGIVVDRVEGSNREATALQIANKYFTGSNKAVLANGYKGADALIGGYYAKSLNAPILLVQETKVHADVQAYITANVAMIHILGGTSVVSASVETAVNTLIEGDDLTTLAVNAVDARTIKVQFSKSVDPGTVLDPTTGKIKSGVVLIGTTDLSSGDYFGSFDRTNRTLTIMNKTASQWDNTTNYVIVVDNVKDLDAKMAPKFATTLVMKETVIPFVVSVTAVTKEEKSNQMTITFSEPVTFNSIKVDGKFAIATAVEGQYPNVYNIVSAELLDTNKAYEVEINGLKDLFENVANNQLKTQVTIVRDTVKPSITSVKAVSETEFDVVFDKEMSASAIPLNAVQVKKGEAILPLSGQITRNADKVSYRVSLAGYPIDSTKTNVELSVAITGLADSLGNVMVSKNATVTLVKDLIKPTLVSVVQTPGQFDKLNISFSENITFKGSVADALKVRDAQGKAVFLGSTEVVVSSASTLVANKTTLTLNEPLPTNGTYRLVLVQGQIEDKANTANTNVAQVLTFNYSKQSVVIPTLAANILSKVSPTGAATDSGTNKKIAISFVEGAGPGATLVKGLDPATGTWFLGAVQNPSNYTVDGGQLPAGATVTLDVSGNFVVLDFGSVTATNMPNAFKNGGKIAIGVSGVKTTAGATLNYTTTSVDVADKTAPALKQAFLTGSSATGYTLTIYFTENLNAAIKTELLLNESTNTVDFSSVAATAIVDSTDKTKVTIALTAAELTSLTLTDKLTLTIPSDGSLTKDSAGNAILADTTGIVVVNYSN